MKIKNKTITYKTLVDLLSKDFTKPAAEFLADWYSEEENESGIEIKLDLAEIRFEWKEFKNIKDLRAAYFFKTADLNDEEMLEYLNDETTVFELETGHFMIWNF
jgi:hypothetical protein